MYNFMICSVNISNAKPHEYSVKHEFNVFLCSPRIHFLSPLPYCFKCGKFPECYWFECQKQWTHKCSPMWRLPTQQTLYLLTFSFSTLMVFKQSPMMLSRKCKLSSSMDSNDMFRLQNYKFIMSSTEDSSHSSSSCDSNSDSGQSTPAWHAECLR